MQILMTGGSGFVGTRLTERLVAEGHRVTVLTRAMHKRSQPPSGASFLQADPTQSGAWQERAAEHEVIINLAGASIFRRWSRASKKAIRDSRVLTTRNLVEALSRRGGKETLLISTSAVGYYGFRNDEALDETAAGGDDFLASVCREWEAAALEAEAFGARVVICRFGIVLGKSGGALAKLQAPFKWCLGSPLGSGKQCFSWIHEQDLVNVYLFLLQQRDVAGPLNCAAPNAVNNRELTRTLGKVLRRPTFLPPVPGFAMRLIMGEFGTVLLNGQRAVPRKLLQAGFQFQFADLQSALEDLLT